MFKGCHVYYHKYLSLFTFSLGFKCAYKKVIVYAMLVHIVLDTSFSVYEIVSENI